MTRTPFRSSTGARTAPARRLVALAGLAAVLLGVAGCSPGDDPSAAPPTTAAGSGVAEDWDLDGTGLMALYDDYVAGLAVQYQLDDPPETSLVRFVGVDEWAQAQVDCLAEQGFGARLGSQGGIEYDDVPSDQAPALSEAAYVCAARYAVDPRTQQQLPRVRARMQYEHLVSSVAPCVREQGYDAGEAPSAETWLGQYYAGEAAWDPFASAVADLSPGEADEALDGLYASCSHDAPDLYPDVAP